MRKSNKGFTLIEIIVVVVILAVLLAVAVPTTLKYVNEADDARRISEAKSILTASEKYLTYEYAKKRQDGDYSGYLVQTEKDQVVSNAEGKGKLISLYYKQGVIQEFTYQIDDKYVLFLGYNDKFVVQDHLYEHVAQAIIQEDAIKKILIDYYGNNKTGTIDSEAEKGGSEFVGAAKKINQALRDIGVNPDRVTWQIEKVASKDGKQRFQFLITNTKLTTEMKDEDIIVKKYIYYEDGTEDRTFNNKGEGNFDVEIKCKVGTKIEGQTVYAVIEKPK